MKRLLLALLIALTVITSAFAQNDEVNQALAELVASQPEFAAQLANYERYSVGTYLFDEEKEFEGENIWEVEFYIDRGDDSVFLGWALVDGNTNEIIESFIPRVLSDDEMKTESALAVEAILADPEVSMLLVNREEWNIGAEYNPYEEVWEVYMERGLEAWVAYVYYIDEPDLTGYFVEGIFNEIALEEEDEENERRTRAIMVAFDSAEADAMLDITDNWTVSVQHQGGDMYSVEFISGDQRLLCQLVSVHQEVITAGC